jgi:hypothetical protein
MDKPKVEKKGIKRDADSLGIPRMPNPAPVHYLGGAIYTLQSRHMFMVMLTKGDRSSSRIYKSWGRLRNKKEAWGECIAAIQAHKK